MLDRTYIRFRFKISLHIDDLEVLNVIKSNLNIGKIIVEEKRNSCAFVVQSFSESKDVLATVTSSLLFNNLIMGVCPCPFSFILFFIIYYYGGLLKLKRSGNNYSLLVVKRLRDSGLLFLNRSASYIRRPNNIARFYSSGTTMHIVQPIEQDLIKLEP